MSVLLAIAACNGVGTSTAPIASGSSFGGFVGGTASGGGSITGTSGTAVSGSGIPQSCAPGGPGMTNCGAGGSGTESCCASLPVTGGTYYRTYAAPQPDDAGSFVDAAFAADAGPADQPDDAGSFVDAAFAADAGPTGQPDDAGPFVDAAADAGPTDQPDDAGPFVDAAFAADAGPAGQPDDAGPFVDAAFAADAGPAAGSDPATVSTFRLDKYDVTVGRFRQFVNAWNGGWFAEAGSGKHAHLNGGMGLVNVQGGFEPGWVATDDSQVAPTNANLASCSPYSTWTASAGTQENLPINCVNWPEAYAFCIWDGGFLPSEAEWEYAAAGGSEQREYPWGSTDPGTDNEYAIYGCDYPTNGNCSGVANIAPVGTPTLGAGLWGQLDLAGNVTEWTLDWWTASYSEPCVDCGDLAAGSLRVTRGGSFESAASDTLPTSRAEDLPGLRDGHIGFRCARSP
jgi:sulfatase modifying factor 1